MTEDFGHLNFARRKGKRDNALYKLILSLNKRLQNTGCATTTRLAVWQNGSIQIMSAVPFNCTELSTLS